MRTFSPSALINEVSTLNCLSEVRLPLAAREVPCVRFSRFVRQVTPRGANLACPCLEQHSVLADLFCLGIQFFRSEPCGASPASRRLEGLLTLRVCDLLLAHSEVETRIAPRPPHRSRRAVFPHRALRIGDLRLLS